MDILVTGGCGFVGSTLAIGLSQLGHAVKALDNLKRRGAERNIPLLAEAGVEFLHGDVRNPEDLEAAGDCEILIECSAEPSVHTGYGNSPAYLLNSNLVGLINCLEYARKRGSGIIFFSTSRVYPIASLRSLPLERGEGRLVIPEGVFGLGWSARGIGADYPLSGSRSLYGSTKLAAELIIEEYNAIYGTRALVNRCGVIAGARQMGKVDQGFFSLWAARHLWKGQLAYHGFGGEGMQVRDVLHADDLLDLVAWEVERIATLPYSIWNVGGGHANSVSLRELSGMCAEATGNSLNIGAVKETAPADIPWYITDNAEVTEETGWRPRRPVSDILSDIMGWLRDDEKNLKKFFIGN